MLAVLHKRVYQVYEANLRIIAPGKQNSFQRNVQRLRAVGNTVSNLTGPRFEPQTSRSRVKRVTKINTEPKVPWQDVLPLIEIFRGKICK